MMQTRLSTNGKPSKALIQIMNCATGQEKEWDLQEAHIYAQKHFLRPQGVERWQVPLNPLYEAKRDFLFPLFQDLGLMGEVGPHKKNYDHIAINGASAWDMYARMKWLEEYWKNGKIRAPVLSILTGERLLDSLEQDYIADMAKQILPPSCTEVTGARLLWEFIIQEESLQKIDVVVLGVPMKENHKTHQIQRPNTKDSMVIWLERFPNAKNVLSISNNPYIYYQHLVFLKVLEGEGREDIKIETAGPANPSQKEESMANYLDTIARCLYVEVVGA